MKLLASASLLATLTLSPLGWANPVPNPMAPVPEIAGKAYLLTDFYSNQVLASRDPNTRVEPASLTKLMTAYLTFKALAEKRLTLEQTLLVSPKGWKTEGSRMFLDPKVPVSVSDLIRGMIVQSGNDACVTLAEAIAGSEEAFALQMTVEAKRLGMNNSHFVNATGLPGANHFTTVHDLGVLAGAIVRDYPAYYPIYSMKEFRYNNITKPNRNLLLYRDPNVDGMKTGFTDAAGYNLIASAKREGRRVISVVVGTTSPEARATESAKLLSYGLQFFDTPKLYSANKTISTVKVYKGAAAELGVGFQQDIFASVPKGSAQKIQTQMTLNQPLMAPIQVGQVVGKLTMTLEGQPLAEQAIVALAPIAEGGFFTRLIDSIKLWFA